MKLLPLSSSIAFAAVTSLLAFAPAASADNPISPSAPVNPPETIAPPVTTTEGFMIVNGMACTVHEGKATPITHDMILRVSPNGTITGFDGRAFILPSGHLLTIEARFTRATMDPPVLGVAPTPTGGNVATPLPAESVPPVVTAPAGDGSTVILGGGGGVVNSPEPGVPHRRDKLDNVPKNNPTTDRAPTPSVPNAPQQSATFAPPVNNPPGVPSGALHGGSR